MSGGSEGGGVAAGRSGTWVMGTPMAPQAQPVNQQAATGAHPPNSYNYTNSPMPPVAVSYTNGGSSGGNPYVHVSPVPPSYSSRPNQRPMDKICDVLNRCGKRFEVASRKAESLADSVWNHLRTGPSVADAAMARLSQGTKVLTEGGQDKVFQRTFEILPGEKLLKAYACHISTSTGPVIGTLYLSNKRLAFCSDYPLCYYSSTGQQEWIYYKVVVLIDQLTAVNPSANRTKLSEKYIQIITRDGYEFWFMGFISYDKALKNICKALERPNGH